MGYIIKKTESCLREAVKYKFKISAGPGYFLRLKKSGISPIELDRAIEKAVADFHRDLTRTVVTVDHGNLARIREEALGTQDKLTVPEEEAGSPPVIVSDKQNAAPPLEWPVEPPVSSTDTSDGWDALRDALNATEREALSIALRGGADIGAFADRHGVMPEILADSINEKAMDHIGDNILEMDENMTVYEEYRQKVSEMVG